MRTTLNLNDALLARAKAEAARRRTTLTRVIEQGLTLLLAETSPESAAPAALDWVVTTGTQAAAHSMDWTSNAAIYEAAELEYDMRQAGLLPSPDPGGDSEDVRGVAGP